jgi:hypothetical protein
LSARSAARYRGYSVVRFDIKQRVNVSGLSAVYHNNVTAIAYSFLNA